MDEVASFIEANKLKMNQLAFADDLVYLKRAGRVAPTSAFFGGILKIKPLIISDALGNNVAVEKVKGRPAVTKRALQLFAERYDASFPYPIVAVAHADCEEEAKLFAEKVKSAKIPAVVVTLGGRGSVYADMHGNWGICPAESVQVRDTTGAVCAGSSARRRLRCSLPR